MAGKRFGDHTGPVSAVSAAGAAPGDALPGLTVAAAARRLGVAPATLRTWDRRYGLAPSTRSVGSHRRYTVVDMARLELMARLIQSGVSSADAARVARNSDPEPDQIQELDAQLRASAPTTPEIAGPLAPDGSGQQSSTADAAPAPRAGRAGGGRVIATPGGSAQARGLARAAMAMDSPACTRLALESIDRRGVVWTWNNLLRPVLFGVGEYWESNERGIEIEHLLCESVLTAFAAVTVRLRRPMNARPVVLACTPEEMHSLPLVALAAALTEVRIGSRVLGMRVPEAALLDTVERLGPSVVVLWSQLPQTADRVLVEELAKHRVSPYVMLGGAGWDTEDFSTPEDPPVHLAMSLDDAVEQIHSALR